MSIEQLEKDLKSMSCDKEYKEIKVKALVSIAKSLEALVYLSQEDEEIQNF